MKIVLVLICCFSMYSHAENTALPMMQFYSALEDSVAYDYFKKEPLFSNIEKKAPGSPIKLFAYVEDEMTSGGMAVGLTTLMMSAASLGVVPVVSNNDVTVNYLLTVHGKRVAHYSYTGNFTKTEFFWTMEQPGQRKLNDESRKWLRSTADRFIEEVEADEQVKALLEDYNFYFSESSES